MRSFLKRFEAIESRIACHSQLTSSSGIWGCPLPRIQRQFQSSQNSPPTSEHRETASRDYPDHGTERDSTQLPFTTQILKPVREDGAHISESYFWTRLPTATLQFSSIGRGYARDREVLPQKNTIKRLMRNGDGGEGGDNSGDAVFTTQEEIRVDTTRQHGDVIDFADIERSLPESENSGTHADKSTAAVLRANARRKNASTTQPRRLRDESESAQENNNEDTATGSMVRIRRVQRQKRRSILVEYGIITPPEIGLENTDVPQPLFRRDESNNIEALQARIYSALQTQDSHTVFQELRSIAYFQEKPVLSEILTSLPNTTFAEVLRHLDPSSFVGRYVKLHQEIGIFHMQLLGLPSRDPLGYHQFCHIFLSEIDNILHARRQILKRSTLIEYRYLLRCARITGNMPYAEEIWKNMKEDSVAPDIKCYNDYLATRCYGENSNVLQRRRLRVISHNTLPRTFAVEDQPLGLRGHAVKRTADPVGIHSMSSSLFMEMMEAGIPGDEETFCLLMVASAREGRLDSVAAILKRAWAIDVEAVEASDEKDVPPVKKYAPESSFHPSDKLLFTLAHIYGINNRISQAMRLVDYVSRQFNIPIPLLVWDELFRYTVILSRKLRRGFSPELQTFVEKPEWGQLPRNAPERLWRTMTSEPYNIKPTMEMHDGFIHNLINHRYYGLAKEIMESGRRLHMEQVENFRQCLLLAKADQTSSSVVNQEFGFQNPNVEWRRREAAFAQVKMKRSRLYIRRWVVLWLKRAGRTLRYHSQMTVDMPDFVRAWKVFLPPVVEYHLPFGKIEIRTKAHEEQRKRQEVFRSPEWLALQERLLAEKMKKPLHDKKYRVD